MGGEASKIITSNCNDLADWVSEMFPGVKEQHKAAIAPRLAVCETIVETLYSGTIAQSGSQNFLPEVMSNDESGEAIKALFGRARLQ